MEYIDQPKFVTLKLSIEEVRDLYHGVNVAFEQSRDWEKKLLRDKQPTIACQHAGDAARYNKLCNQFLKLLNGVG